MQKLDKICTVKQQINLWKQQNLTIALVPTMGNLHDGHLSLIQQAQKQADKVVCSIFVNPLQFGENEDLNNYPRTLSTDITKLEQIGCDMLFYPSVTQIYPKDTIQTNICVSEKLTSILEGKARPGHFTGVATIVCKLFNITKPNIAIFGQKDYQQFIVIQQMVQQLNFDIQLIMAPIVRESNGIALSSRNQYLSDSQRKIAPNLYRLLQQLADKIKNSNEITDKILDDLEQKYLEKLLINGFDKVDYISILDKENMQRSRNQKPNLIIASATLGSTRLLDNIIC